MFQELPQKFGRDFEVKKTVGRIPTKRPVRGYFGIQNGQRRVQKFAVDGRKLQDVPLFGINLQVGG